MPINWDEFQKTIDAEIAVASKQTSESLASRASSVTRLTDEEVSQLFPTPIDVQKLKNLMEIVKSAEADNTKINRLIANVESLGGTVIKLLGKLA